VTIAEALKPAGYRSYYSGKWHCGGQYSPGNPDNWQPGEEGCPYPLSRGFDRFYGTVAGCGNFFNPHGLMDQDRFVQADDPDYYYTDAISEHACRMIDEAVGCGDPFFMHVCYTAPHWPLHAPEEDIARYEGKYRKGGWDTTRAERHERLKAAGMLDEAWPISPRDADAPPWDDLHHQRRDWEDMRMAVYAAMVDRMDQGIGRIMDQLDARGVLENTVVMFLSDNGGCAEFLREDGEMDSWPGRYAKTARNGEQCVVGNILGLTPGSARTFMSYDLPWANASNSPFRLYKHWVHEGGIATPLVCHWPAGLKQPGGICHSPVHIVDFMATILDLAGADYPEDRDGVPVTPTEGESFAPALRGERWQRERPLFWEHEGNRAVRDGEWKLVSKHPGGWELYNMNEDRTELNDLAAADPDRVARMTAMYDEIASRAGVLPWQQVTGRS
jgi:arylsulfatase